MVEARNEPCAPAISEPRPYPVEEDGKPVPKADEEVDVDQPPEEPGHESGHREAPEICHRGGPADRRHRAEIPIGEPAGTGTASDARRDQPCHVSPFLLRDGAKAGKRISVRSLDPGRITEDEDLREPWQAEV